MTLEQKAFLLTAVNPITWTTVCIKCLPFENYLVIGKYLSVKKTDDPLWEISEDECTLCGNNEYTYYFKLKESNE